MTQAYTSGLEMPQETLIAEALTARIRQLRFLRHVGEAAAMPSRLVNDPAWDGMLQKMRGQAPAAFVIIESSRAMAGGMTNRRNLWKREFDVVIAVFSGHRRDTIDGRLNPDVVSRGRDDADPGIRAMCELIDTLLMGWSVDIPGVYEMEPDRVRTVFVGNAGTLREMTYHVRAERRREPWPDVDTFLESVNTTFDTGGMAGETELV